MTGKNKKILSKVGNILIIVFLVFAVLVTIYSTIATTSSDGIPSIGKNVFLSIQSPSMDGKDGFPEGSMIIAEKIGGEQTLNLKEGDVITFKIDLDGNGTEELNTHRIIKVLGDNGGYMEYKTKGDNNDAEDEYVVVNTNIVAIWKGKKLDGVGSFMNFMTSKYGFLCLIVLPLGAFFVFELINVINIVKQIRGKKTITKADEEEIKRKAIEEYLKSQNKDN